MNVGGLRTVMLFFLVFPALSLPFLGCSAAGGGGSGGGGGGSGEEVSDLSGIWLTVFRAPYFDYDGPASSNVAESMVMEVADVNYQLIFYYDTLQVGGNKGTFTVQDGKMLCTVTGEWNSVNSWAAPPSDATSLEIAYSLSGATVTLARPKARRSCWKRPTSPGPSASWATGQHRAGSRWVWTLIGLSATRLPPAPRAAHGPPRGRRRASCALWRRPLTEARPVQEFLSPYSVPAANTLVIADETIPDPDTTTTYAK